jgi:hypothetical protein
MLSQVAAAAGNETTAKINVAFSRIFL